MRLLGAVLASKKDFLWRVNVAGDRTRQIVRSLDVPPYLVGPVSNTTIFRLAAGQPFGIVYGSRWLRSAEQVNEMIASKRLSGTAADYVQNEEGFYVAKSAWRTGAEPVMEKAAISRRASETEIDLLGLLAPRTETA